MSTRYYANAPATTLAASCTSSATTIQVASVAGLPISYPFTMILDRGAVTEEVVSVTNASGTTLSVTRGYDGTTAFAHAIGAEAVHGISALDPREANQHINASTGVHGLSSGVVGTTDAQTLSNKTLSSPVINSPTINNGTFATPTIAYPIINGPILTEPIIGSRAIRNIDFGSAFSASLSNASSATMTITLSGTMPDTLYTVLATLSTNVAKLTVQEDSTFTRTTTQFRLIIRTTDGSLVTATPTVNWLVIR